MNNKQHSLSSIAPSLYQLTRKELVDILQRISTLKVGIIGDGCLDIYWHADMRMSELSRETPHHNLPITQERYSPGAAGNVAVNFKMLNCSEVKICTVLGNDWRGELLKEQLTKHGINYTYTHTAADHRFTPTYCKVIRHGLQDVQQEDKRLDFVNRAPLTDASTKLVIQQLDRMAAEVDVISVIDQVDCGVINADILERLQYWSDQGKLIVVDSRNRIQWFQGFIVKPNEVEVLQSYYGHSPYMNRDDEADIIAAGLQLSRHVDKPICVTLGNKGALWIDNGACTYLPTEAVTAPINMIGAGDTFNAALLSALGVGCSGEAAVQFAHLAAAVSICTLGGVGAATPDEILQRYDDLY